MACCAGPVGLVKKADQIEGFLTLWLGVAQDEFAVGLSALRRGRAGWLIALLAGGVAAHLFILVVIALDDGLSAVITLASHGAALAFAPVGMTYAALLWTTLYLRRPSAFIGPVGDAS